MRCFLPGCGLNVTLRGKTTPFLTTFYYTTMYEIELKKRSDEPNGNTFGTTLISVKSNSCCKAILWKFHNTFCIGYSIPKKFYLNGKNAIIHNIEIAVVVLPLLSLFKRNLNINSSSQN